MAKSTSNLVLYWCIFSSAITLPVALVVVCNYKLQWNAHEVAVGGAALGLTLAAASFGLVAGIAVYLIIALMMPAAQKSAHNMSVGQYFIRIFGALWGLIMGLILGVCIVAPLLAALLVGLCIIFAFRVAILIPLTMLGQALWRFLRLILGNFRQLNWQQIKACVLELSSVNQYEKLAHNKCLSLQQQGKPVVHSFTAAARAMSGDMKDIAPPPRGDSRLSLANEVHALYLTIMNSRCQVTSRSIWDLA